MLSIVIIIIIIIIIITIIIIMPKRAAKRASCEVTLHINGTKERWIGGMAEYPKTRNALLYEKRVSKNGIAIK